ncbi:MAG: hypothetical protein KF861_10970 [Planctomycetaceae bacterium]|nr:hypothetical protein [Planctomycetaceae bacterium]
MKKLLTLLPLFAACVALAPTHTVQAKDSLNNAIQDISEDIEIYLKEKKQLKISIGNFEGPPGNSSGRKLASLLKTELAARSIEVAPFSNWEVRGAFQVDTKDDLAKIAIQVRLVNSAGAEVSEFRKRAEIAVDQLEDVLAIAQPASFDGESAIVEKNENASEPPPTETVTSTTEPVGSDRPAAGGTPAEQSAAQASDPPSTTSNPPAAVSNPPAAGGTPATAQNPPVSGQNPPAVQNPVVAQNPGAGGRSTPPAAQPPVVGTGTGSASQPVSTGEVPGGEARDARLLDSIRTGGFHLVNPTTMAASSTSPYHIQVKVRRAGASNIEPLEIQSVSGGLAFCDLQEGDFYSIIVTNTAPHDVGLELMIDGVNSLYFSEIPEFTKTGKWLIRGTNNNGGVPYSARIDGWYRNPQSVYAFEVTAEPNAVASEIGLPARIGTITATFYGAWVGNDVHPLEAKLLAELGSARGDRVGTSKGPQVDAQSTIVERHFGKFPLASVSIRYVNPEPPLNLPPPNAP